MKKYLVTLMDKSQVEITEQEFKNLAGKDGLVYSPSADSIINTRSVVIIKPAEKEPQNVPRLTEEADDLEKTRAEINKARREIKENFNIDV